MPPRTTELEVRVRYAETDQMGVVYHANYLVWCEMGRTEHLRAMGTAYRDLERDGVRLAVADARMRFHAPARYDDRVSVRTRITDVKSRTITFDYELSHAASGCRLASVVTMLISMDAAGSVRRMPDALRKILAADAGLDV
ncbi:MAG TPA: thioesterase family protein [Gemmatimonadaceae bacterium]|nr:thioesterase family protein [Gemmatimonadaceae bacterium]